MEKHIYEYGGKSIEISLTDIAKRSRNSLVITYNGTKILCTLSVKLEDSVALWSKLTINYIEKIIFPSKKGPKSSEREILMARRIDQVLRPFVPTGINYSIHLHCVLLEHNPQNPTDLPSIVGCGALLGIANLPGVHMDGFTVMTIGSESDCFIFTGGEKCRTVVALCNDKIVMMDGQFSELSPAIIRKQLTTVVKESTGMRNFISNFIKKNKMDISFNGISDNQDYMEKKLSYNRYIIENQYRKDGRTWDQIRPISIEWGSCLGNQSSVIFRRGETTVLAVATTINDSKTTEKFFHIGDKNYEKLCCSYNFFPFSVDEPPKTGGITRREIGHSKIMWYGISPVLNHEKNSLNIDSYVLSCNGSSSMASVTAGSMAGNKLGMCKVVTGIAMGLFKYQNKFAILTDITGEEDEFGLADMKITGSKNGCTHVRMDSKSLEIPALVVKKMITSGVKAINDIHKLCNEKTYSSQISLVMEIDTTKLGIFIGTKGKNIKQLQEKTGAQIQLRNENGHFTNIADLKASSMEIAFNAQEEMGKFVSLKTNKLIGKIVGEDQILCLGQLYSLKKLKGDFIFVKLYIKKNGALSLKKS